MNVNEYIEDQLQHGRAIPCHCAAQAAKLEAEAEWWLARAGRARKASRKDSESRTATLCRFHAARIREQCNPQRNTGLLVHTGA